MKRAAWGWLCLPLAAAAQGPSIHRAANLPSGAPAFDVRDAGGQALVRIECLWNGWYEADALAARMIGSTTLMAAILAKGARITSDDLGPGRFDCVVVRPPAERR